MAPSPRRASPSQGKQVEQRNTKAASTYVWRFFASGVLVAAISVFYYYQYEAGRSSTPALNLAKGDPTAGDAAIFTVVDLPGKGKGAIAARDIKQGEVIIREKPLFVVPLKINSSPSLLIAGELQKLPLHEKQAFLDLSYVNFPRDLDPEENPDEVALAIFQTNGVSAGENVGVFPRMARLNHGCSSAFNAVYFWREDEKILVIHALKDIRKGQELLTTYTNSKRPRDERRAYLSKQYGFLCTCDVCSLPDELSKASDERLSKISALYEAYATWGSKIDGVEAINHIRKIWQLEDEEGYWSERGQLAADATWVAAAHSDANATRAWAQKAVEWYTYEIGADTHLVREVEIAVDHPQRHKAWGTRHSLEVGGPSEPKH